MERFKNIRKFNTLWNEGAFTIPLVILIGGAAGTGKSTIASKLKEDIAAANLVGTPIFRTILKLLITPEDNPYLYKHTFDLYPGNRKNIRSVELLEKYYEKQSEPIMDSIEKFIHFVISEKQNYIIEGSNILPRDYSNLKDVILIEFYISVPDADTHRSMFSGPTHNREISDNKFENLRLLNEYIVELAVRNKKMVYSNKSSYVEILKYIDGQIGEYLRRYYLVK